MIEIGVWPPVHDFLVRALTPISMRKIFAGAALFLYVVCAHAIDSMSAELGSGTRSINLWRVGVQWEADPAWLAASRWDLYWDLSVGSWHSDTGTVHDVGLTPVFRYARGVRGPYFEGAIGFHVLSDSHISTDLRFGTRFQFGDHLGVGYRFNDTYDLGLRLQHLSNGGMRNPNPGVNFLELRLQYYLR